MKYPLQLRFKLLAIAQQITATDASEKVVFHVKQKAFKLKEAITVFADVEQTQPLYTISADRVIDFSARYNFKDAKTDKDLGAIKRHGMRSLWKSHYEIFEGDQVVLTIKEENPWIKLFDALLTEIPVVGMFAGYLFHPVFIVARPDGKEVFRAHKQAAMFEGSFRIEQIEKLNDEDETRAILSLIMMLLLERNKG